MLLLVVVDVVDYVFAGFIFFFAVCCGGLIGVDVGRCCGSS